ncbi:MAG TPA: hypothetical protein VFT85_06555 [Acidimicrobiia bacterium]|nr:hypothetical protein [Acidimicrobiia bacterium]
MDEIHDFDDTVVAVFQDVNVVDDVTTELGAAGYAYEVLQGEEGRRHLDPGGDAGAGATMKRLLNVFGDQYRVLEHLNEEMVKGGVVISVDSKPDEAGEAVTILEDHGGEFIWKLGAWTYTQISE